MRMWMIDPKLMCQKHILGEHGELHKHRHVFEKGWSIEGRVSGEYPQIEVVSMKLRHDELVVEMLRRKMNHQSPYKQPTGLLAKYGVMAYFARVDKDHSMKDLCKRCSDCAFLIRSHGYAL